MIARNMMLPFQISKDCTPQGGQQDEHAEGDPARDHQFPRPPPPPAPAAEDLAIPGQPGTLLAGTGDRPAAGMTKVLLLGRAGGAD
jgi:hypothetical protein